MSEKPFSILIVDDNKQNLMVLADILENSGYETGLATNGKQALAYVAQELPDLILLDVMMPEMDGYETCTILKSNPQYKDIPVMFLTAKVGTDDIVKGFEVGGVDYISKPFNSFELKSRVKTHLSLKRAQDDAWEAIKALNAANKSIEHQNEQLNQMVQTLDILSKTDPLTGLFNRRTIIAAIELEARACKGSSACFSIVMGDIDRFKKANDTYGHDFGDFALNEISDILSHSIRSSDILSRWGGEEFLIMFKGIGQEACAVLTERIRKTINDHKFKMNDNEMQLTMTFGVSEYICGDSIDDIIKKADNALYKGKESGRNTVMMGD